MDWITLQECHFLSQEALDVNNSLIFIENHGNAIVKSEIHGYSSLEENSKDHLFHISDLRQGQTLSKLFLTCDWLSHSQNSQPGQKEISCSQKQSAGVTPLAGWRFFPWCSTKGAFLEPNNCLLKGNQNSRYSDTLCYADREKFDPAPSVLSCALDFQDYTMAPLQDNSLRIKQKTKRMSTHFYLHEMSKDLLLLYIKQHSYQSSVPIEAWKCKWYFLNVFLLFQYWIGAVINTNTKETKIISCLYLAEAASLILGSVFCPSL